LELGTPNVRRKISSPAIVVHPKATMAKIGLTPVMESFDDLKIFSSDKKYKDDFGLIGSEKKIE
jgi:hypothetical protein